MLTYKKALALLENSNVEFNLEYSKTVDIRTAMSRKQGSRHPQLVSVSFHNLDENGTYCYVYLRSFFAGVCNIEDLTIQTNYVGESVDENGEFDSKIADIENAIRLLLPEILENYIEEDTEE